MQVQEVGMGMEMWIGVRWDGVGAGIGLGQEWDEMGRRLQGNAIRIKWDRIA